MRGPLRKRKPTDRGRECYDTIKRNEDESEQPFFYCLVPDRTQHRAGVIMAKHSHAFVETFDGMVGYGLERQTDEDTLQVYLQKFSDDDVMKTILKRMTDDDLDAVFEMVSRMLSKHLTDEEYHRLFLKDDQL